MKLVCMLSQEGPTSLAQRLARAMILSLVCIPCALCQGEPTTTVSLTVEQAIQMALKQNRDLKMKNQDVVYYKALKDKQRASYFPTINNLSKATYVTDLEGVVLPLGVFGSVAGTTIPARTLRIDQGATRTLGSGTHLTQGTTDLFAVRERNRAAKADLNQAHLETEDTAESLAISVRQTFYSIQVALKSVEAARAAEKAAAETLHEAEAQKGQGSALNEDVLQDKALLLARQQEVLKLRVALHRDMLELADDLGAPVHTEFIPLDSEQPTSAELPSRAEATQQALKRYPKVLLAENSVAKARASLREAEDAYIPQIDLTADYEYQSGVPFLVHNFGVFGAELKYDLFNGGAREATIRAARAELKKAQISLDETRDQATVNVEEAYDAMDQAAQALDVANEALAASSEAARVANANFRDGVILPSKRDTADALLLASQAAALDARLSLTLSQDEVRRALGQVAR